MADIYIFTDSDEEDPKTEESDWSPFENQKTNSTRISNESPEEKLTDSTEVNSLLVSNDLGICKNYNMSVVNTISMNDLLPIFEAEFPLNKINRVYNNPLQKFLACYEIHSGHEKDISFTQEDRNHARLLMGRILYDTLLYTVENEFESVSSLTEKVVEIFKYLEDGNLTSEIMKQVPQVVDLCQMHPISVGRYIRPVILPCIICHLRNSTHEGRSISQIALFVLLEQNLVTEEELVSQLIPGIIKQTDCDEDSQRKMEATTIIAKMCPLLGRHFTRTYLLERFIQLCNDTDNSIRRVCSSNFVEVCTVLAQEEVDKTMLPIFIMLCNDSIWTVRKRCLEVFVQFAKLVSLNERKDTLTSNFISMLEDKSSAVSLGAFNCLGPFISTFADPEQTPIYKTEDGSLTLRQSERYSPENEAVNMFPIGFKNQLNFIKIEDPIYNEVNFWKIPLPYIDLPEIELENICSDKEFLNNEIAVNCEPEEKCSECDQNEIINKNTSEMDVYSIEFHKFTCEDSIELTEMVDNIEKTSFDNKINITPTNSPEPAIGIDEELADIYINHPNIDIELDTDDVTTFNENANNTEHVHNADNVIYCNGNNNIDNNGYSLHSDNNSDYVEHNRNSKYSLIRSVDGYLFQNCDDSDMGNPDYFHSNDSFISCEIFNGDQVENNGNNDDDNINNHSASTENSNVDIPSQNGNFTFRSLNMDNMDQANGHPENSASNNEYSELVNNGENCINNYAHIFAQRFVRQRNQQANQSDDPAKVAENGELVSMLTKIIKSPPDEQSETEKNTHDSATNSKLDSLLSCSMIESDETTEQGQMAKSSEETSHLSSIAYQTDKHELSKLQKELNVVQGGNSENVEQIKQLETNMSDWQPTPDLLCSIGRQSYYYEEAKYEKERKSYENLIIPVIHKQNIVPEELLKCYVMMVYPPIESNQEKGQTNVDCAFSLPGVALTIGREHSDIITHTFQKLVFDSNWKVRRTLAASIHQMAYILGEEIADTLLLNTFNCYMTDVDSVRHCALRSLSAFMKALSPAKCRYLLPKLQGFLLNSPADFRFNLTFVEQISEIADLISEQECFDFLCPIIIQLIRNKAVIVRRRCYSVISKLVKILYGQNDKYYVKSFARPFIACSKADSWWQRQDFVFIVHQILIDECIPLSFWCNQFFQDLIKLTDDKVPNVRMAVAKILSTGLKPLGYFETSLEYGNQIENALETLQSDLDRDVRYFCYI